MKANSIEQYRILQWLEQRFFTTHLEIELIDRNNIKITDENKNSAIITYSTDGTISFI